MLLSHLMQFLPKQDKILLIGLKDAPDTVHATEKCLAAVGLSEY